MSDIKISVPYLPGPLRAAALYLTDLAAGWADVTVDPPVEQEVLVKVEDTNSASKALPEVAALSNAVATNFGAIVQKATSEAIAGANTDKLEAGAGGEADETVLPPDPPNEVLVKVEDTNFNAVASKTLQEAAAALTNAGDITNEIEANAGGTPDETMIPPDPALVFGAPIDVKYILQGAEYTAEQLETAGYTPEMIQALPLAEAGSPEADSPEADEIPLANGIPWDSRINVSTKTILAKKPNDWKLKRMPKEGYTTETWEAYVESVRAELRQAQAAPANTLQKANDTPPELDFPRLCGLITKHGITDEQIAAACTKVGPIAFAVIGTRPDLIDPLARELGIL